MNIRILTQSIALALPVVLSGHLQADVTKAPTGTNLVDPASWGGVIPMPTDTAIWETTSLGAGLTLNDPAAILGIKVNGALSDIDLTGTGILGIGTGGIDTSGTGIGVTVANPIFADGAQTWATDTIFNFSGAISGTGALTIQGKNGASSDYSSYLTPSAVVIIPNATLADLTNANAHMNGAYVGGAGYDADAYKIENDGTTATLQFRWLESPFTKCVKVELMQSGADITGRAVYAKYINGSNLAFDFDGGGNNGTIATSAGAAGYGVETSSYVFGEDSATTLAGVNTHSGGMIFSGGTVNAPTGVTTPSAQGGSLGTGDVTIEANTTVVSGVRALGGGDQTTRTVNINGGTANIEAAAGGGEYLRTLNLTAGSVVADSGTTYFRTPNAGADINSLASADPSVISTGIDLTYTSLTVNTADGAAANDLVLSGNITQNTGAGSGAKSITKNGPGSLLLSGNNAFTGGIAVNEGTLKLGSITGFGTYLAGQPVSQVTVASGAMVDFNGTPDGIYGYTISGDGINGAGALTNSGAAIGNGKRQASNILLAADASIGGSGNWSLLTSGYAPTTLDLAGNTLTKTGTNTIALVSTTVTGGTISVAEGTFALGITNGGSGTVAPNTAVILSDVSGVFLPVIKNSSIGSLSGGGSIGGDITLSADLTVGALGTDTTFDGIIGGAGAVVKTGVGTLTLAQDPNWTGGLAVNEGTLEVQGLILGAVTAGIDGTLSPGAAAISSLEADSFDLQGTTLLQIDKNGAILTADQLIAFGNINLGGTLEVTATGDPVVLGDTFQLFTAATFSGGFTGFTLPLTPAGLSWDASNLATNGTLVVTDVVQAPTLSLPGGGYAGTPEITLSGEPGATLYYTLNGDTPTTGSTEYTGPITLPANTTGFELKVIATKPGQADSAVVTATYTTLDTPAWNVDLPGNWSDPLNWLQEVVPNGPGIPADFNSFDQTGDTLVTLDSDHTVGSLVFGNTNPFNWEIGVGGGTLTLDGGGTTPTIEVASQEATINAPVAGTAGLTKTGPNGLTLGGANTYEGVTTVAAGRLTGSVNAAFGATAITLGTGAADASLYLANRADVTNDVTVDGSGSGLAVIGADNTGSGANAATFSGTLTLNRATTFSGEVATDRLAIDGPITGNVGTLTVSGGARTTFRSTASDFVGDLVVTGAGTILQAAVASAGEVIPDATNVTVETDAILQFAITANGTETINALNGSGTVRTFPTGNYPGILAVGSADGTGTFSGTLADGNTPLSLTKLGTGTQTLSGANTYSGPTAVNDGTLAVTGSLDGGTSITVTTPGVLALGDGTSNPSCWIRMIPTANNTSNSISGDGTANLNDSMVIDVSGADLTDGNSWLLVDVSTLTETYGPNFEVTGFTESSPGIWTATILGADWTFTEATGTLSVEVMGFAVWAAANAPGQTIDQDHDADGTPNGVEFFMGESGSGFTAMPVPDATNTVSFPKSATYTGTYGTDYWFETSGDLQTWTPVPDTDPNLSDGATLDYMLPAGSGQIYGRLQVAGP